MADLGKVTGTITSLEMVGGTVGAIVSGVLSDATGSFASTWIVCLVCSVAMLVFLLASEPSPPSCVQAWRGSRRPSLFSVCPVLFVAALEAEWMLVPSFGFQGGHGPTK